MDQAQSGSTYTAISSHFHIDGNITSPEIGYDNNRHSPLYAKATDMIKYKGSYIESAAVHDEVLVRGMARTWIHAGVEDETSILGTAETELLFKPNFSGKGDPIMIYTSLTSHIFASIDCLATDNTTGETIFHIQSFVPKTEENYDRWNQNHEYRLYMKVYYQNASPSAAGGVAINNNIILSNKFDNILRLSIELDAI